MGVVESRGESGKDKELKGKRKGNHHKTREGVHEWPLGVCTFFGGLVFLHVDLSWTAPTNYLIKELGARTDLF